MNFQAEPSCKQQYPVIPKAVEMLLDLHVNNLHFQIGGNASFWNCWGGRMLAGTLIINLPTMANEYIKL